MDKFKVIVHVAEIVKYMIGKDTHQEIMHIFDLPLEVEAENYAYAKIKALEEFHKQVRRPNGKPLNYTRLRLSVSIQKI